MDRNTLNNVPQPQLLGTNSPIFSPLVQYDSESSSLGTIPFGTVITVSGTPGTGKTRYVLQVLENIAQTSLSVQPAFYSYEMGAPRLSKLLDSIKSDKLTNFKFSELPEFKEKAVVGIDSLDQWATLKNEKWPTDEMATEVFNAKEKQNAIVFLIHHKTKTSRTSESGSAYFPRVNDIHIDLLKQKDGTILATTRRKNRYPSQIDQLILEHTSNGLVVQKTVTFKNMVTNLWTRLTQ